MHSSRALGTQIANCHGPCAISCVHCAYYVVTPARPCRDTRPPYHAQAWSRHQKLCRYPKRPNCVATSKLCRDTTSAHSEAFRSRHQKPCHDTPAAPSVATPKTVLRNHVVTPKFLTYVATPKTVSRHTSAHHAAFVSRHQGHVVTPHRLPLLRHKYHVATQNHPSPNLSHVAKLSRHGDKDSCHARVLPLLCGRLLSRAPGLRALKRALGPAYCDTIYGS